MVEKRKMFLTDEIIMGRLNKFTLLCQIWHVYVRTKLKIKKKRKEKKRLLNYIS
jgi:hypothetical protein